MGNLDDYALFVAILDSGSISAAARQRKLSVQAASRALARLEQEVGVQLVRRTTRALTPTAAGKVFLERIRQPVLELELAKSAARDDGRKVEGNLRIGAPAFFGSACLAPVIARFAQRWRALRIELVLTDRYADLLDERLDMAIRIGELPDSTLRARRLTSLRRVIFAAPSYLAHFGKPATPDDLSTLPCVVRTFGPERNRWPVTVDGAVKRVPVNGVFLGNDAAACNEAVAAGVGIGMAPYWQVRPLMDAGRVDILLADYEPPLLPVHILWHGGARLPARAQLLIDMLIQNFRDGTL